MTTITSNCKVDIQQQRRSKAALQEVSTAALQIVQSYGKSTGSTCAGATSTPRSKSTSANTSGISAIVSKSTRVLYIYKTRSTVEKTSTA